MVSKISNNNFLSRINYILGDRRKHPWGKEIGLKSTRIQGIFSGIIPTSDALICIRNAEKASIDWLITGDGSPYLFSAGHHQTDENNAKLLTNLLKDDEWVIYVIYNRIDLGVSLALTRPRVIDYEGETGRFIEAEIMQASKLTLDVMKNRDVTWLHCDADTYEKLVCGWVGPHDLNTDKFENRGAVKLGPIIEKLDGLENKHLENFDEDKLISCFRNLSKSERNATLFLLEVMDEAKQPGNKKKANDSSLNDNFSVSQKASSSK